MFSSFVFSLWSPGAEGDIKGDVVVGREALGPVTVEHILLHCFSLCSLPRSPLPLGLAAHGSEATAEGVEVRHSPPPPRKPSLLLGAPGMQNGSSQEGQFLRKWLMVESLSE